MIHKIVRVFSPLSKDSHFVSLAIPMIWTTANIWIFLHLFFRDLGTIDYTAYTKTILSEWEQSGLKCSWGDFREVQINPEKFHNLYCDTLFYVTMNW